MNNFPELEELVIDEKIEELIKGANCLPFPAVTVSTTIYFNVPAMPLIPNYIKWSTTPNYVIIIPAKKTDCNAYPVRSSNKTSGKATTTPSVFKNEKKIKCGTYKLYKYKNGLAFKRYEPLEGNANG